MIDFVILAVIALLLIAAVCYIVRSKKKGVKCIGCPASGSCTHHQAHSGCGCGCHGSEKKQ